MSLLSMCALCAVNKVDEDLEQQAKHGRVCMPMNACSYTMCTLVQYLPGTPFFKVPVQTLRVKWTSMCCAAVKMHSMQLTRLQIRSHRHACEKRKF